MKYKILKYSIIMILIIVIFNIFLVNVSKAELWDVIEEAGSWKPTSFEEEDTSVLRSKAGVITGAISIIGTVASLITITIIGIKFMLGSVEEKAQYKQTLIPWIIGACMVFAMTLIPNIIFNLVTENKEYNVSPGISDDYTRGEQSIKEWLLNDWTGDIGYITMLVEKYKNFESSPDAQNAYERARCQYIYNMFNNKNTEYIHGFYEAIIVVRKNNKSTSGLEFKRGNTEEIKGYNAGLTFAKQMEESN